MKSTALILLLAAGAACAATDEQINKSFPASPGGKLVIDVGFGEIKVDTNGAPGEIAVDVWRKVTRKSRAEEQQFLQDNPVQFQQEGNVLTIQSRDKTRHHWFGGSHNRNEATYTVRVPAQFNARLKSSGGGIAVSSITGDVSAETSGGGLRFTHLNGSLNGGTSGGGVRVADCEGTLKVHTSGGGITVTGGTGTLDGDTSGGRVEVKDFHGNTHVETSGGGITIENVVGQVDADTSGGSISAELPSSKLDPVKLSTSGGGVTVRVPEDAAFDLDAETSGGRVSSELPVTVAGKMEHDRLKGAVNGGGNTVRLRSSGGGIHVEKLRASPSQG